MAKVLPWSRKALREAIVRTRLASCLDSVGTLPLAFVHADDMIKYGSMGTKLVYKNSALDARLNESIVDAKIDEVVREFDVRGLPFAWWVGDDDTPTDLEVPFHSSSFYSFIEFSFIFNLVS